MKIYRKTSQFFNCFGYALESYEWENFGDDEIEARTNYKNKDGSYSYRKTNAYLMAHYPLEKVPYSIIKNNLYDKTHYYPIAFRCGAVGEGELYDFHFMKQNSRGQWLQKCGAVGGIWLHEGNILDPWPSLEGGSYNGKITFYLVKKVKTKGRS